MTQALLQSTTQLSDDHPSSPAAPRLERKFQIQFLASERFMKKFERAKALLSNKNGTPPYEAVLEAALDEFLKDRDPATRVPADGGASRHIPAATRDAVFARDKGRCTYVGSNRERCGATHNLEIDHIAPYARGGANAFDNLRLLCERHNKHEAERVLGANTVRRFRRRE